jgi:hypothetical protein
MVAKTKKLQKIVRRSVFRLPSALNHRKLTENEIDREYSLNSMQHRDNEDVFDLTERISVNYNRNEDSQEDEYDFTLIRRANPISEGETSEDSEERDVDEQRPFDVNRWISSMFFKFIGKPSMPLAP